jgi:aminomethyltransferase
MNLSDTAKKKTVLHDWHLAHGANMATFAGYDMPLWYPAGARAEHLAPIRHVGIFDTSHMPVLTVTGPGARELLQYCFCRDLERCIGRQKGPLVDGRCTYGFFLSQKGHVIDDAIVYQLNPDAYMIVANAGMGPILAAHLGRYLSGAEAEIRDLTDRMGKIDIQGPDAGRLIKRLIKTPDRFFDRLVYFSFKGGLAGYPSASVVELLDGTPLLIARTGYTGEFGFELFMSPEVFPALWQKALDEGRDLDVLPCGLAARDSLRVGAVLPLSHQDIGDWPFAANPWLFALPRSEDQSGFTKDFLGAKALRSFEDPERTLPFAGYDPRKIVVGPDTLVTDPRGEPMGRVLTCATDMAIGRVEGKIVSIATPVEKGRPEDFNPRGLCCGFVKVNRLLAPGQEVILTDGKRQIKVEIRQDIRPDRTARRPIAEMV